MITPDAVRAELAAWMPPDPQQGQLRDSYLELVATRGEAALFKGGLGGEHLTASCVVFSPDLSNVLLTHHRKGGFWVQFGGHLERDDASLAAAAQREVCEESGIAGVELVPAQPLELHHHGLGDTFGACRGHLDVVYAALVDRGALPVVSDESLDVAWFDLTTLPTGVVPDLPPRLEHLRRRLSR